MYPLLVNRMMINVTFKYFQNTYFNLILIKICLMMSILKLIKILLFLWTLMCACMFQMGNWELQPTLVKTKNRSITY